MSATSAPPIRARLFAMAAGFLAVLLSSTASATSFGEIMGWCSNRGDEGDQRLCIAYVSAALELMRSPDPVSNGGHHVCVPDTDRDSSTYDVDEAKSTGSGSSRLADSWRGTGQSLSLFVGTVRPTRCRSRFSRCATVSATAGA